MGISRLARVAPTAIIDNVDTTILADRVEVWHLTHVRSGVHIGEDTRVGSHCVLDLDVVIGKLCKIQSHAMLFRGSWVGDRVFIGPGAMLLNDKHPRAAHPDGSLLRDSEWTCDGVMIHSDASIGAGAILMPGITIGAGARIGAGSVVTRDVPPGTTWHGEAARPKN